MNTVISKWLGECRHEQGFKWDYGAESLTCQLCHVRLDEAKVAPDYENDESAWTQEVYGRIEAAGMNLPFVTHLIGRAGINDLVSFASLVIWEAVKATPAQKAQALSRAIEEGQ